MMTSKTNQIRIGIVWLCIFPLIALFAYDSFPVTEIDWLYVVLLFAIMCVTMLIPIQMGGISISLERWITFAIFLQYGMFVEFIFIQFAMFILLFSAKSSLPLSHKFFANSIIFSITSLTSAFVFTLAGGKIHSAEFVHVLLYGFLYAATYTFVNSLLMKLYFKLNGQSFSLLSKVAIWDYLSTVVMVPMSVALYFLNAYLGNKSILLIGIPILTLLITIRQYNDSNHRQKQLAYATEIGRDLANQLLFNEVLNTFLDKLRGILPFDDGYVVDLRSGRALIPLVGIESGEMTKLVTKITFTQGKEENDGLNLLKTKIFSNSKEVKQLKNIIFEEQVQTVMSLPIIRDSRTEGFLILTSKRKNAFKNEDIKILEILTNYFAVSLEKARHFEQVLNKSERCGLTKLHNYRYLDRKMEETAARFYAGKIECVSVVILDIDFFKKVNDTYGHENGNIILIRLADILQSYQKEQDMLARYGGEEFVMVFPNCSKEEATEIAEAIRKEVEHALFSITSDLEQGPAPIDVQITISLGVATMPDDALSARELIRNADRALYIDGKQAGRNRVGVFGSSSD